MSNGNLKLLPKLSLISTIGYDGRVPNGLLLHPDGKNLVYSLGCTVVIREKESSTQTFLSHHNEPVSAIAVSKSGRYVASGQVTFMGFRAPICIWNYGNRALEKQLEAVHKTKIEALAFSPSERYLCSLGGQDDDRIVLWDLVSFTSVCGSMVGHLTAGISYSVKYFNTSDFKFVSGGNNTLRVWSVDLENRKLTPTDIRMGKLKRNIKNLNVDGSDEFCYCGTTSGDVLKINLSSQLLTACLPDTNKYGQGVTAAALFTRDGGSIIVGAGDGLLSLVTARFKVIRSVKLNGSITAVALTQDDQMIYVGTSDSEIYKVKVSDFDTQLWVTCHSSAINDVVFPWNCSELFVTCAKETIRVWYTGTSQEMLRIKVPNMTCNGVDVPKDGKSIISAWNDGKIRAFSPQTGKLLFTLDDAHNRGVTAIASTHDCKHVLSGGGEGKVRVWLVGRTGSAGQVKYTTRLIQTMKEHKGAVACIRVRKNDEECVTASADGTCILWDLQRYVRSQVIFANTLFRCVSYHPEECQIITSGTDRKIGYWETFDGSQIRELEASETGAINAMDVSADGQVFVTGGDDKIIRVWLYNQGHATHVGIGHSGKITKLKICPKTKSIVSVSEDGGILMWKFPIIVDGGQGE